MTAERSWDAEYDAGRYVDERPVEFVAEIVSAWPGGTGLYVGCGNGRNFVPLWEAGLDLVGLDISGRAIAQLAERVPGARLVHGDLDALPPDECFDGVVGIQVFQHGTRAEAHTNLAKACEKVRPGGLLALRVNAVGTDVWPAHDVIETAPDGGFTVRYTAGSKRDLAIHFFSADELSRELDGWEELVPLRLHATRREPPAPGRWLQWEAIWRRPSGR